MKRIICLFFSLVMCFSLFVGCSGDSKSSDSNNDQNSIFSTDDIMFVDKNGDSVYSIIRPDGNETANQFAVKIFKALKAKVNVNAKNSSDIDDGTEKYEILIGDTNRPETEKVRDYLVKNVGGRFKDYIVCTIDKKIVIYGMSVDALSAACDYFEQNFIKPEGVKGGILHTYKTEGQFLEPTINGVKLSEFQFVRQRFNESYVTQKQLEDANALLTEKAGYLLPIKDDSAKESEYEIIVGNADRNGVAKSTDNDEYSIVISGKKVYLNGGSPAAKAMAVSEFAKMLVAGSVTDNSSTKGKYSEAVKAYDSSKYHVPTWTEDFDVVYPDHPTGINLKYWKFGKDTAEGYNGRTSVRTEDPQKLFVKDGMLNFYASYDDEHYYGFKLQTAGKVTFKYGILEMSAILPHGDAFWVALWGQSSDKNSISAFMNEVNIVEMFGNSASYSANSHGWPQGTAAAKDRYNEVWKPQGVPEHWSLDSGYSGQKKYYCPEGNFNSGLHTFSYVWYKNQCTFACDGNAFFSINPNDKDLWNETFNQCINILLSQATGFKSRGTCSQDNDPVWLESNNFQIDYIHLYQLNDGEHILTDTTYK